MNIFSCYPDTRNIGGGGWVELVYERNIKECKTNKLPFKKVFGALININRLGKQSGGINLS